MNYYAETELRLKQISVYRGREKRNERVLLGWRVRKRERKRIIFIAEKGRANKKIFFMG